MWQHCPAVLILRIDCSLRQAARRLLAPLLRKSFTRELDFSDVGSIKGLEFQHVILLMPKELFAELQSGFTGTGQRTYNYRRLLRIPFSRAKDSLVAFGLQAA
jgi:DNA helicase IV